MIRICSICLVLFALVSCQSTEVEQNQAPMLPTPAPEQIVKPAHEAAPIIDSAITTQTAPTQKKSTANIDTDSTYLPADTVKMDPRIKRILDEKLIKHTKK